MKIFIGDIPPSAELVRPEVNILPRPISKRLVLHSYVQRGCRETFDLKALPNQTLSLVRPSNDIMSRLFLSLPHRLLFSNLLHQQLSRLMA